MVTISIPDSLYQKAQLEAERTDQPIDAVIRVWLEDASDDLALGLSPDEDSELKALAYLSDEPLWTIAREQMRAALQERMATLMTQNSRGALNEGDYAELTALVALGDRLMLRKAEAMKLLTDRGFKITPDDLKADGE